MRHYRTSKHNVWCARVFLWIVMVTVLGLATAPAIAQDLRNGPLVSTFIGSNEFQIPRRYFLPGRPKGERPAAVLLTALLPTLAPMREDNIKEFLATRGYGRIISILLLDASRITTLAFRLDAAKKLGAPYEQRDKIYGLTHFIPKDFDAKHPNSLRQELFVDNDEGGTLVGYIECSVDGSVPVPGCNHEFVYRNLLIHLSYGKTQLPNWRTIEDSVKRLFDSFERGA